MILYAKVVFSSFMIPRGQRRKLTIAKNEQTGPSNVTRLIYAAKAKGILKIFEK
jgi:hypothetical protein